MIGLVDGNNFYVSCERVFDRKLVGKPVAVLSNNDGCCVAMSNEFKALGIPRGTPYFQLRDRARTDGLIFRSSNYELYGDMSRRIVSILREEAVNVEQYSIDEAFIEVPDGIDYWQFGSALRKKILRWVGIPCGIGFAATKTLAKIANHIGKKLPDGVFVMPTAPSNVLATLPVGEVWGVGRRLLVRLRSERIVTALDLHNASDGLLLRIGGIMLVRTATELRGAPCIQERSCDVDPDSVSCSRSFGEPVRTFEALFESVASFTAQAAEKLRCHDMLASGCNIYAQLASGDKEFHSITVSFGAPTDATNEMLVAIRPALSALYMPGAVYRKSGIVFFGLEHCGSVRQQDLFEDVGLSEKSSLYSAIDTLNAKFGRGRVFSASEGIVKPWKMKRSLLSRRPTTVWSEILTVR